MAKAATLYNALAIAFYLQASPLKAKKPALYR